MHSADLLPAVTLSAVSTMSFFGRRSALGILGEVCSERRVRLQLFASLPPHDLRCCLPNGVAAVACGFGVSEMMGISAKNGDGGTAWADVAMPSAFRGCLDLVDATQFRSPIWCDQEFLDHGSRRGVWAPALPLQQGTKAYGSVVSRERRGRSHAIAFARHFAVDVCGPVDMA
ncbi:hypothetical protein TGPRC2_307470 [Toxoplasma gondii TgCatPRC2]|uniref:Uncharacterized protein n=1 Tax=Toxoplasma gondii TgCatPRC2 TaxID=1130821 RepID=A0A151GZ17_TOXGO|nr:hypothetical protein TGPRC2_307470 [Toxoplasma gondii TgCatPRC2]